MISKLDSGTTSKELLKVGQVNCHNKSELIDELFEMDLDLLLIQEPGVWFKNKKHNNWARVMADDLGDDEQPRAVTYVRRKVLGRMQILKVSSLTNRNMVTISINNIEVTNIYNRMAETTKPLSTFMRIAGTRERTPRVVAGDFNIHHPSWQSWVAPNAVEALSKEWIDWIDDHGFFLFSEPDIPTYVQGETVIDLVFASEDVNLCDFLESEDIGSDHYLQFWSIDVTGFTRDGRMEPHLEFNTLGGGFNFKHADWDHFSDLIAHGSMDLESSAKRCKGKAKVDELTASLTTLIADSLRKSTKEIKMCGRSKQWWTDELKSKLKESRKAKREAKKCPTPEAKAKAKECGEEFAKAMSEAKRKCWNDFLSSRNSNNIWDVLPYVKKKQPHTVVSQLTRKDGTTTKEFSEIVDCFFQELFPPAPSSGLSGISLSYTEDTRWPKLKASEIEQALYQQAPYKAPGPDNIKTIAIRKAWKVRSCRKVITNLFRECIRIGYHPKAFREGQTVILRKPNKPETLARSYRPITLLNCLGKVLEKVVQRRLASLTADIIPKQQFGGRNGFSTTDALAKLISYTEMNQNWDRVTSILAIDIKGAFDNVHKGVLLKTMSDMGLPEASRSWVHYFMNKRKTRLIIDGKVTQPRRVDSGIPQGSPISPLLFLIYTGSLYRKIKETGAHVVGFIDDITIYKGGRDIDKNTATLSRVLQICHEWAQECHTEFDYGDKLGFLHIYKSKSGRPKKKKKRAPKRLTLPIAGLGKRQAQKSLKLLGVTIDCELKFQEHAKNVISKAKKVMGIIGKLGGVYKGISCQTMKQLYISCVRPIFEYASPVWYHKLTGQWKDEIQKVQNTGLRKILGAFRSAPIKAMQRDAEILPVNIRMKEISDRFAIRAIRAVSPRNPVWKLANSNKPAEGDLEKLFARVKQMDGIDDDRYWSKRPPWKQPKYDRNKKSYEAMQKLKSSLYNALQKEWQTDYDIPSETSHYYSIVKRELYGGQYPNPLKSFMNSVPRHTFSKLFQLRTGHGVLGKYFQKRGIKERSHNCECGQLETVEHILKECPLHPVEREVLRKVSPELDLKILLDTKKGLDAVVKFLDSLPQLLC